MAYPSTESGYNMYDMLSMIQKAIRRGDYENAGYAANELKRAFRAAMWNRILVISAEDCFGVLTKELLALKKQDEISRNNQLIANAVALMCRAKKSRDACYFSCNFVAASRNPRDLNPKHEDIIDLEQRIETKYGLRKENKKTSVDSGYDSFGFMQMSIFNENNENTSKNEDVNYKKAFAGVCLQKAIKHRDMDMLGYEMDVLRRLDREYLWRVLLDYADRCNVPIIYEIIALMDADDIVNKRRKDLSKDEIFISKAAMLLCYCEDEKFSSVLSSEYIKYDKTIDWSELKVKRIEDCRLSDGKVPEWVYDCHTLKGKKMGKTDWDMTTTEQAALYPLEKAYFDDASWIYTYEQDLDIGAITLEGLKPIREFAKTHLANPVEFIPYKTSEEN